MVDGGVGRQFSSQNQEAGLKDMSGYPVLASDVDAVLAELFEMGFPLDAAMAAIRELGSLNKDALLEFMLRSENNSSEAAVEQEAVDSDSVTGIVQGEQNNLLPVTKEVDEYFTALRPVKIEPDMPSSSTSAIIGHGGWRISDSLDREEITEILKLGVPPPTLKFSRKSPLLQRLLEMGCRPDVAVKAYEIYGRDPAYGSEEERLDVMCDYVAAFNLNDEDDDLEAENEESRDLRTPPCGDGLDECLGLQGNNADSRIAVQVEPHRSLRPELAPGKQEQNELEYTPGGYYKYLHEADPYLEELFQQDLEDQEGMALFAVKRKKGCEETLISTRVRGVYKRPQVTKCLVGPVTRRIKVPHYTNMTGYGVPGSPVISRRLPDRHLEGPPYFYFENVAFMPGDEWDTISRHLYDIEPEFVNAYHFTVCKRPRGYVHNLPVEGRFEVLPRAPRTIKELVPYSTVYWPSWDDRTTFNCICTSTATEAAIKPVTKLLGCMSSGKEPPSQIRRQVMDILKMYNMVWIGPGQVARPKVEELEVCMGFDRDHTRPILSSNQQVKGLGNAFQVHTVGYHLSVLKKLFPDGLNVLSLFSGIGGAEVALHRLGIKINVAVCVEIDAKVRRVIEHWWKVTNQTGRLITKYEDVNQLDYDTLQNLLVEVGGFDLLIGGSPCSNLSAKNRFTRMGLGGKASIAFFEYARILKDVRAFGLQHRHRRFHV